MYYSHLKKKMFNIVAAILPSQDKFSFFHTPSKFSKLEVTDFKQIPTMFWCVNSCGYFTFFTLKLKANAKYCRGITFLARSLGIL